MKAWIISVALLLTSSLVHAGCNSNERSHVLKLTNGINGTYSNMKARATLTGGGQSYTIIVAHPSQSPFGAKSLSSSTTICVPSNIQALSVNLIANNTIGNCTGTANLSDGNINVYATADNKHHSIDRVGTYWLEGSVNDVNMSCTYD